MKVTALGEGFEPGVREADVAYTLTTGGGKIGQSYAAWRIGDRVVYGTAREYERLQGFPDGWTLPTGPSLRDARAWYEMDPDEVSYDFDPALDDLSLQRREAMGRTLPIPIAQAIGERLRDLA